MLKMWHWWDDSVKFVLLIYLATNLAIKYSVSTGDSQTAPYPKQLTLSKLIGSGFQTNTEKYYQMDSNYTHWKPNREGMYCLAHFFCAPTYSLGRGLDLALSTTTEILSLIKLIASYSPFLLQIKGIEKC